MTNNDKLVALLEATECDVQVKCTDDIVNDTYIYIHRLYLLLLIIYILCHLKLEKINVFDSLCFDTFENVLIVDISLLVISLLVSSLLSCYYQHFFH